MERDGNRVRIWEAYAAGEPGSTLGGLVEPDLFRILALVATDASDKWDAADTFLAAFQVGTVSEPSKYGGMSGVTFRLTNGWNENQPQLQRTVSPTWPDIITYEDGYRQITTYLENPNFHIAESDRLKISCTPANKIIFSVPGDSEDVLQFRVRTAAMATPTAGTWLPYWQKVPQAGGRFVNFADHRTSASPTLQYECAQQRDRR